MRTTNITSKRLGRVKNLALAAILLFGGIVLIADLAPTVLHLPQRAFNLAYLFGVLPMCIGLSDIVEWAHPEFFEESE